MRLRLVSIVAAGVLLLAVGVALAAKPKGNYTFSAASSTSSPSMYFKTSSNGKKLTDFYPGDAIRCGTGVGGFGGIGTSAPKTIKVSKKGTFKVSAKVIGVGPHPKTFGKATITGKFVTSTKATGKITWHYDEKDKGKSTACWGVSKSYTATGTPTTTG